MSGAWSALLGAFVGGFLTLAGALAVELRRDRRRQIGAARLIVGDLDRAVVELMVITEDAPKPGEPSWYEGPHRWIRTRTWDAYAADFIGRLDELSYGLVEQTHRDLAQASELGFTYESGKRLIELVDEAQKIVKRFATPTWFDRRIWRL